MDINDKVEALSIDNNDTLQGEGKQASPLGASSAAAAAAAPAAVVEDSGDGNAGAPSTSGNDDHDHDHPRCYVIVHNVSKRHNVGTLLRSCTAFGVAAVCLVGGRHFNTFGSHGAAEYVALRHFTTLDACAAWLRGERGCRILGVEIDDGAAPVTSHPFTGPTAFLLGNEGQGLSARQLALCDGLVYIPQHGPGTASLNVSVAAGIVLHHFATWARLPERPREGAKFAVGPRPTRTVPRGVVPLTEEERAERAAAAAEGGAWMEAALAAGGLDGLLESLADDGGGGGGGSGSGSGSEG